MLVYQVDNTIRQIDNWQALRYGFRFQHYYLFAGGALEEMGIKVGINGFGRIGRGVFRTALGSGDFEQTSSSFSFCARADSALLKG